MNWRRVNKERNSHIRALKKMRKNTPKGDYKSFFTYDILGYSDYADIYFVGKFQGKNVMYNATIKTLKLDAEDEIYCMVEDILEKLYPEKNKNTKDLINEFLNSEKNLDDNYLSKKEIRIKIEKEGIFVQPYFEVLKDYQFGVGLTLVIDSPIINAQIIVNCLEHFHKINISDFEKYLYGNIRKIDITEIKNNCSVTSLLM